MTYPRSGTTWISCIAANLMLNVSPNSLTEIDHLVPDIHAMPEHSLVPPASYYLIKSHFPLTRTPPFGEYRRVIYLIRDPRDVLFSYYRFAIAQYSYKGDIAKFATDWVAGRIWPCSWQEHVTSWLGPRKEPPSFELTLLRYENFIERPIETAIELARALGLEVPRARIEAAVADSSPDAMRRREAQGAAGARNGLQFIGSATSGGWRNKSNRAEVEALRILEQHAGRIMGQFGFESDARRGTA